MNNKKHPLTFLYLTHTVNPYKFYLHPTLKTYFFENTRIQEILKKTTEKLRGIDYIPLRSFLVALSKA